MSEEKLKNVTREEVLDAAEQIVNGLNEFKPADQIEIINIVQRRLSEDATQKLSIAQEALREAEELKKAYEQSFGFEKPEFPAKGALYEIGKQEIPTGAEAQFKHIDEIAKDVSNNRNVETDQGLGEPLRDQQSGESEISN